jgi:hypothetical protein
LLIPCFWHSRIQAGDLSSHIYNSWLTLQIESHPVPGLTVARQFTNVLFDIILTEGQRRFGPDAAQRIAVSLCVLIFFWGSYFFVRTLAQRPIQWLTPALAMLSYGWLFHSGFFNFYLSFGLCLFAISFWLRHRRILAVLILPVACTAHSLPVAWAVASVVFLSIRWRYAFPAALMLVAALRIFLQTHYLTLWFPVQFVNMTGFDQLDVFGTPYAVIVLAVLLLWAVLARQWMRELGTRKFLNSPDAQLLALLSLSMAIIPTSVKLPGYTVLLGFLPNRLSIGVALVAWGVVARIQPPRWIGISLWCLMLIFGAMLYRDTGKYNQLEDQLVQAIDRSARGQRIIASAPVPAAQTNLLTHMIDRACVGRCYSYANYEPSTLAFRVRTTAPNPIVVSDYDDSMAMQTGAYRVKQQDLPLFQANIRPGENPPVIVVPLNPESIAPTTPHP